MSSTAVTARYLSDMCGSSVLILNLNWTLNTNRAWNWFHTDPQNIFSNKYRPQYLFKVSYRMTIAHPFTAYDNFYITRTCLSLVKNLMKNSWSKYFAIF